MSTEYHKIFQGKVLGKSTNPVVPHPEHKEQAVTEELVHIEHKLVRPTEEKPLLPHRKPHYNVLYNSLGVSDELVSVADNFATGNFSPVASPGAVTQTVTATNPIHLNLSQWPGAISCYPVIRSFHVGQSANVSDVLQFIFFDNSGNPIPLCIYDVSNSASQNYNLGYICPSAVTDVGNQTLGQIVATTINGTVTTPTIYWMLGISFVYLIPAIRGYEMELPSNGQHPFHYSS